jgi:hypothetical protein
MDSIMIVYHKSWGGYSDSTIYQNNIFVTRGKGAFFNLGKSTNNFFLANLFQGGISNLPSDPEGIDSDPEFVGEDGINGANPELRFLLQRGSPAINSGLPIEQNGGHDFSGKELDTKPDRGPFRYR